MNRIATGKDGCDMTGKKHGYTVVVGCGRLGAGIADGLYAEGEDVMGIDQDRDAFRKLSSAYGGLTVEGNGMDLEILKSVQLEKADTLIAVTDRDNVNIIVSEMAKQMFNVTKVIARLSDPQRSCVYQQLGIETICPSVLSARQVDHILNHDTESISEAQA